MLPQKETQILNTKFQPIKNSSRTYQFIFVSQLDKNNPIDPGPCTKAVHGQIKLVQDRLGKDRVIICVEESDGLIWKSFDGTFN